jgi:hypothetical protein
VTPPAVGRILHPTDVSKVTALAELALFTSVVRAMEAASGAGS